MRRSFLLLATAATALVGCASIPPAGVDLAPKAAGAYATDRVLRGSQAGWPQDVWWSRYGDTQLNGLVEEALASAPSLAEAAARVRRSEALASQAGAALRPTVALNAQVAENHQSQNMGIPPQFVPDGYNEVGRLAADLSWDLDIWGRNRASLAAATSEAEAARMDAAQARLMLTTSVVSAYADLTRLFATRDVAMQGIELRQALVGLSASRVREGITNEGEERQAEAALGGANQDLAALDEQIGLTRNRIAALVGQGPDRGLQLTRPTAAITASRGLPPNVAVDLIGRRPDVQAARLRAEATAKRVDVARAGFYPNVNLAAYFGRQSLGLNLLTDATSEIGQAAVALSLPIFAEQRLTGTYNVARADYDAAVAAYDRTLVQALQEVADAATSERQLQARLEQSRQTLTAATEAARIARLRYEGGLTNILTALTAQDAVINQTRVVAELETRSLALDAQMARALGGGFRSPE